MSKQEEIRESIEQHVGLCLKVSHGIPSTTFANSISKSLVQLLDEQGVVIKVDRELPKSPDTDYIISQYDGEKATAEDVALMHLNGVEKGKGLMIKAGYVAVEPLVKEYTNDKGTTVYTGKDNS